MDVKNALLGDLHVQLAPGVDAPSGYVCRLHRAFYGLKQFHVLGLSALFL